MALLLAQSLCSCRWGNQEDHQVRLAQVRLAQVQEPAQGQVQGQEELGGAGSV
tara:strand:- start:135 stop:293 length:159 start_codon:yes stop_codon:yes gene_type:complete